MLHNTSSGHDSEVCDVNDEPSGATSDGKAFYITTPLYYVNDKPHIGHAYTSIASDAIARFKALDGYDVKFLTGTDEHGQKVEKAAAKNGVTPQQFTDEVSQAFRDLKQQFNLSFDDFIRTTEARHKQAVQAIWQKIQAQGDIYLGEYSGWYAVRDEAFYQESELVDGKASTGAEVEWVTEQTYFFKLSAWGEKLLEYYDQNPDFIAPKSRRNEVISFVEGGLKDLSISRSSFKWGIEVPDNPEHVMYVWFDALTNYISALGYPDTDGIDFYKYWPNSLHIVGKDILRFHAVYWPAFLMAAGLKPPQRVFAHGWWTNEGEKISKSLGNAIDPVELAETYGRDQVRYFLLREVPFGNDGDFSRTALVGRMNSDLANAYGNLVQRVMSFIFKNCDAKIPEPIDFQDVDAELMSLPQHKFADIRQDMEAQSLNKYLEKVWQIIAAANRYVDAQEPWSLKKSDPVRMQTILYSLAETIRQIAILTQPIMPDASAKILEQLSIPENQRCFANLSDKLRPATEITKPAGVFPRWSE